MIKVRFSFPKAGNLGVLERVLREGKEGVANILKEEFEKTTETWEKKPVFIKEIKGNSITVYTESDIYRYVSRGTPPHEIVPKNAKFLRFRGYYKAKTTPRVIGSFSGGHEGPVTYRTSVSHPGVEAREFEETIAESIGDDLSLTVQDIIDRALIQSGIA